MRGDRGTGACRPVDRHHVGGRVGLGANPIFKFGSDEQQQRWLPDLCAGRSLGAFGLTEPDAGSDAGGTRTATIDDTTGEWVVDGEKAFITNSGTPITSIITVTALTGPGEISSIVVPADTPGLEVQPAYRKMGWHASDTHGLTFVECRVPKENLLGDEDGYAQFLEILDEGPGGDRRPRCRRDPAMCRRCRRLCRGTDGVRPSDRVDQGVAFRCADMQVALSAARQLTYHAAWLRDHGKPFKTEAAIAKLYATEAAIDATRAATQVFGGYGFMDETAVARHTATPDPRDWRGHERVQRLVIARTLGLRV